MMRSVRDVMQLNYFSNVNPDLKPNMDGTVDFVFDITEKENIGQLSLGAAYSQLDHFVGTFSISVPNFRGAGEQLDLNLQLGRNRQDFAVGFTEPWAFDTPTRLRGDVFYRQYIYDFTSSVDSVRSYGFSVGANRRLKWPDDFFSAGASYQLSREAEWSALGGKYLIRGSNFDVLREGLLSRLSLSLSRSDVDLPTFPTRGSELLMSSELCGLGGDYRYLKGTVGFNTCFPLWWKFVLGTKTKIGLIHGIGDNPIAIARSDLFSAGGVYVGDGMIRGYEEAEFGGLRKYSRGDGISMLVLNTEIRFPIIDQQLYVGIFGDMGNTWQSLQQVNLMDTYKGVGFGLRLMVPMLGLLGFDFGWPLDNPNRDGHFGNKGSWTPQFHFIMNKGF
jgi:outer membrane protein insertion porin family